MRRTLLTVLTVGAIGASLVLTSGTASGDATAQSAGIGTHGHYIGRDEHDNPIRFDYVHDKIKHFHVHDDAGENAHVHAAGWSAHCDEDSGLKICSHGHWLNPHHVKGGWTQGDNRHSTHFTAHWAGEIHQGDQDGHGHHPDR